MTQTILRVTPVRGNRATRTAAITDHGVRGTARYFSTVIASLQSRHFSKVERIDIVLPHRREAGNRHNCLITLLAVDGSKLPPLVAIPCP